MLLSISYLNAQKVNQQENTPSTGEATEQIDIKAELQKIISIKYLNRYAKSVARFEQQDQANATGKTEILFVGSSSIRKWYSLTQDMLPYNVLNRGFGGSTLADVIYFYPQLVEKYNPKTIFLYEGDNDISTGQVTPEKFLKLFQLFEKITAQRLPQAKIYFISIKPSPARMKKWTKIHKANMLVKEETEKNSNLFYIDVSSPMFLENNTVNINLFTKDRLHMNKMGYNLWAKIVKKQLDTIY